MKARRPRVAIVDPSRFYRRILSACMNAAGWDWGCFENGYDFIECLLNGGIPFDLVLLDVDQDAVSAEEIMASAELLASQQSFVLMGRRRPESLPADCRFMGKPIDFPLLVRFLMDLADKRRSGRIARPFMLATGPSQTSANSETGPGTGSDTVDEIPGQCTPACAA